jgi:hypothetical protein
MSERETSPHYPPDYDEQIEQFRKNPLLLPQLLDLIDSYDELTPGQWLELIPNWSKTVLLTISFLIPRPELHVGAIERMFRRQLIYSGTTEDRVAAVLLLKSTAKQ